MAVVLFQGVMAHFREVRGFPAPRSHANFVMISRIWRDVRGLDHDRRHRVSHPARPHSLLRRTARAPLHRAGARRREEGRRRRFTLGPDRCRQPLTIRARPACQHPGQSFHHRALARRRHQGARGAPQRPFRAARDPSQLPAPRGRHPRRRKGKAVRPRRRRRRSESVRGAM